MSWEQLILAESFGLKDQQKLVDSHMDDIEGAAMRVLEIPFVIAIGFVIEVEVVMSGLSLE